MKINNLGSSPLAACLVFIITSVCILGIIFMFYLFFFNKLLILEQF